MTQLLQQAKEGCINSKMILLKMLHNDITLSLQEHDDESHIQLIQETIQFVNTL